MNRRSPPVRWLLVATLPWLIAPQAPNPDTATLSPAERLAAMSPTELAELRRHQEMFAGMSPNEQLRLREFDRRLFAEPNPDRLLTIWKEYNRWLGLLDAETRNSLMQIPDTSERVASIAREVTRRRQRNIGLAPEDRLPEGDWPAFRTWLRATGTAKLNELRQTSPNLPREFDPNDRRLLRTPVLQQLDEQDFSQLAAQLSPPGAAILAGKPDREEKSRLVVAWWISNFLQIPAEELQRFLKELPAATRLYIEQLGPEQGQQELKRRYLDDLRRRQ